MEVNPDTPFLEAGAVSLMLTFSQSYPAILAVHAILGVRASPDISWRPGGIPGSHGLGKGLAEQR